MNNGRDTLDPLKRKELGEFLRLAQLIEREAKAEIILASSRAAVAIAWDLLTAVDNEDLRRCAAQIDHHIAQQEKESRRVVDGLNEKTEQLLSLAREKGLLR